MTEPHTKTNNPNEPRFLNQSIFIKNASFDAKKTPAEIFKLEWKPEANIELKLNNTKTDTENFFEVTLQITLTMQSSKRLAYIVEVTQAGVFEIANFDEKQRDQLLNAYCPNMLYPFLREEINHLVSQGGFPQMLIAPVNFDAMYAQQLAEKEKAETSKKITVDETEATTIN